MKRKAYHVKDVARLAKVTVRALHHYDAVGLLVPSRTEAGYRLYTEDDLLRLQQILIYRELGLPLERIQRMLGDERFDRRKALLEQREQLLGRQKETQAMIRAIDAALEILNGDTSMDEHRLFDGFDPAEHEEEARLRFGGSEAYREAARRTKRYSKEDWQRIKAEDRALMETLVRLFRAGARPEDEQVLELAEQHRLHIDRWYYPCSRGMHRGLAEMYLADERFGAAFERHAPGMAAFVAAAIRANAARD